MSGTMLLTEEMLEYLRKDLSNVLYWDESTDSIIRGTTAHGDWDTILLRPDDCQEVGWDIDTCSGIILYRRESMLGGDCDDDTGAYIFE